MGRASDAAAPREEHDEPVDDEVTRLLELGRDREAVRLATRRNQETGETMDVLDQLDQLGPTLGGVVAGLQPSDLDRPTPCQQFDVAGVLGHMVGGATMFAAAYRGEPAPTVEIDEPLQQIGPALEGLMAAIHAPGALDRTVAAPFGEVPGDQFARFVVLDGLVHGWDLATATGQSYDPPAELVAAAEQFARGAVDPLRDGDTFASEQTAPEGATPIERLAAFTGRRVPTVAQ